MSNVMLNSALFYHNEGLCVIPVVERDKRPALKWDEYKVRCSSRSEVVDWFSNGHRHNIGIVHGAVSQNYIAIDIDHDRGIYSEIQKYFPELFAGRVEQSGSGEGYHIPFRVGILPDFGLDTRNGIPRGNRTWKCDKGDVNIRAQFCQTVVPPSIHPSGQRYRFLQKGNLAQVPTLDTLINWLNSLAPPAPTNSQKPKQRSLKPTDKNSLLAAVLDAWPLMAVFDEFGLVGEKKQEKNGEIRLLGHGGLLINEENGCWYCFADEFGGGAIEAWGWHRFGSAYDNRRHFRQVLIEMAQAAGIDLAGFHKAGDEKLMVKPAETEVDRNRWGAKFEGYWERMR